MVRILLPLLDMTRGIAAGRCLIVLVCFLLGAAFAQAAPGRTLLIDVSWGRAASQCAQERGRKESTPHCDALAAFDFTETMIELGSPMFRAVDPSSYSEVRRVLETTGPDQILSDSLFVAPLDQARAMIANGTGIWWTVDGHCNLPPPNYHGVCAETIDLNDDDNRSRFARLTTTVAKVLSHVVDGSVPIVIEIQNEAWYTRAGAPRITSANYTDLVRRVLARKVPGVRYVASEQLLEWVHPELWLLSRHGSPIFRRLRGPKFVHDDVKIFEAEFSNQPWVRDGKPIVNDEGVGVQGMKKKGPAYDTVKTPRAAARVTRAYLDACAAYSTRACGLLIVSDGQEDNRPSPWQKNRMELVLHDGTWTESMRAVARWSRANRKQARKAAPSAPRPANEDGAP